jgi:hypothetical protein
LRSGFLHDLLIQSGSGFSYGGDATELAAQLVRLRDDRTRQRQMSAAATELFEQRFRAEQVYGDMTAALKGIAQAHPKGERVR